MFKKYQIKLEKSLEDKSSKNWNEVLTDHKEMISLIQHERLIHLIVTVFVGTVMSLSFFITILTEKIYLLLLDLPLLILFIAYLIHYRFLENTTQKWYLLTEKIKENLS